MPASTAARVYPSIGASLVRCLRVSGPLSRVSLARELGVAPSTVGLHVDQMIGEGFLTETVASPSSRGRPPTLLELNPVAGQFIGVDFDARTMFATSVDFAQQKLKSQSDAIRHDDNADGVTQRMAAVIDEVADSDRPVLGIGVAVPGTVDAERGLGLSYRFIRGWRNVPLVDSLFTRFEVPVELENNIRTMALAERLFGQCRDVDNFICVGVRSGIGSGLVINGELYRGPSGNAGEIGSWPCHSANESSLNTLEDVGSLRAILNELAIAIQAGEHSSISLTRNRVTVDGMLAAARASDALTLRVLEQAADKVGRVVAQISVLLNLQRVVIAGPLVDAGEAWIGPLCRTVHRLFPQSGLAIEVSTLGESAGAMGAAALAVSRWEYAPDA